jgi:hypothetical protein
VTTKIRAGIIGAAIIAATVAPVTTASAAASQAAPRTLASAAPFCSPLAPWSGYANWFWWFLGGPC